MLCCSMDWVHGIWTEDLCSVAAWVGSMAYGLCFLLSPINSTFTKHCGHRIVGVTGAVICCVSLAVSSFMPNIYSMYASFGLLYGTGTCFVLNPTMTIAGDYFDKYMIVATGITVAGSCCGTLILSPVSQAMLSSIGWRNSFRVMSGLVLVGVWSGYMYKPLPSAPRVESPSKVMRKSLAKSVVKELQLWKNKVFVLWILAISLAYFGYFVPYVHLVSKCRMHVTKVNHHGNIKSLTLRLISNIEGL